MWGRVSPSTLAVLIFRLVTSVTGSLMSVSSTGKNNSYFVNSCTAHSKLLAYMSNKLKLYILC